ncbi:MAG: restriction endonuclease subunit S, partial [Paludibacteraceae bacterium]|nr:restriction endonuclease subunit S [Paludibacteraceae bacterium]
DIQIPLPSLAEQQALVDAYNHNLQQATELEQKAENGEKEIEEIVNGKLGLIKPMNKHGKTLPRLQFINYKDTLSRWDPFNVQQGITSSYPIHPLKDIITSIRTGTTPSTSHKEYFNGNIKFYTPADIGTSMYLTDAERSLAQPALAAKKVRLFYKGELLFVGIGSTVGKIGIVSDQSVSSNQQITGFSVDSTLVSPEFVYCYMHCNKDITTTERTKTTIPVVNQEKIEQIPIPLPPLDVQAEIVAVVQEQRAKIAECKTTAATLRQEAVAQFEQAIFE